MIMKKKICFALLGLLSLGASAQEDTREEVLEVVATSDISEIIGYAKTVKDPTFTMSEGSMANIPYSMTSWNKKNEDGTWTRYNASTFTEGTYRVDVQVRVDDAAGITHKLGEGYTLTVDGQKWETEDIGVYPTYSYGWASSPDIVVDRIAIPLEFTDLSAFDIPANFVGKAIKSYSVVDAVVGGELPYTFSKTSGPDWIQVSADGTVSGTPEVTGVNDELVVRVTDNASEYKEKTISVGKTYVNQSERQKVTDIVATSNISEILHVGSPVCMPSFTMSDGSVAYIEIGMSHWGKKGDDGKWERYNASVFEEGVYSFWCQIRIDGEEGYNYVIGDGWTLTVDGQKWNSGDSSVSFGDGYSCTNAELPEVAISKEVINELTVTNVVEPVEGNSAKYDATLGDNCNLGACLWKEKDPDSEWKSIQGPFTASKLYGLYFRGFPKNGYKFADDMKVIYKGSEIPVSSVEVTEPSSSVTWRDENYVYIFLYFDNLSGVESVTAESSDTVDVYNLQGILVKHNATKEDINSLPAGLYIAGGKKVMLK